MSFLEALLGMFALLLLVPVTVFFAQVLMALPVYRPKPLPLGRRPSVGLLVPAHNEAAVIDGTLRSLVPQLAEGDRLLVVADNCSDETAGIARRLGAEVIERENPVHRGKGYALDFGIRHLRNNPPEVVIIVDADCQVHPGTIDRLARTCGQAMRPVQALYLMKSPEGAGLKIRIAEFAWAMKNWVRPLGWHRLGLPCQLMGTGMAFPWSVIAQADLASGHIVEDMKLGIDLARAGMPTLFYPEALVTSIFPSVREAITSQRTRWEHGHLGMILSDAPALWRDGIMRRDASLLALALDLCVPPLVLLSLLVGALAVLSGIFYLISGAWLPLMLTLPSVAMIGSAVLLGWWRFGRPILSLANLAYALVYALWKIPLYFKFLVGRQIEWVRSRRDAE